MWVWSAWCALAVCCSVLVEADGDHPTHTVNVYQMKVQYDVEYDLLLNNTVEYILDFTPPSAAESEGGGGAWPALLHVTSSGGDTAQPVLLTARQRAGATTWQLPYDTGDSYKFELQRTLCPDDTAISSVDSECEPPDGVGAAVRPRGSFSLHVSSSCGGTLLVRVAALLSRVWQLPFSAPVLIEASQIAPQVVHYEFSEEQQSVRLVIESDDEICCSISVQNYSCPIAQTLADISTSGLRMTVQYSGAVQISRRQFPRGFLVVAVVHGSREACGGDDHAEGQDWLWAGAVLGEHHLTTSARANELPRKRLTLTVQAALSRAQYALAVSLTAALFLAFYLAFVALVLMQRWPPFARLVSPKAVLADAPSPTTPIDSNEPQQQQHCITKYMSRRTLASCDWGDTTALPDILPPSSTVVGQRTSSYPSPRFRNSHFAVETFDSSDGSSSEEEEHETTMDASATNAPNAPNAEASQPNGLTAPNESQGPFGLPTELRLAALAQRRDRTLRARSDRYLYTLATVAVFYALPVVQFVAVVQMVLNVSGSLDICYYNFLCAHPAGALSDFNHVLSNAGYLLLGALFLLQVRRRRARRRRKPRHQDYGIPAHYGLLSALGAAMMVVAVLSASYHVCPNRLNFQFDTAFMYVLAVLSMVKIYQSRHPDVNARAHSTFGVLAVLIAIVVWGVLGGGQLFWGLWTVLHVFTFLLLSLRIYYVGQFRLEKESLQEAARELRRPMYRARLIMLLLANALNWMFAIYGLVSQSGDFAGHMLQVLLGNTLLYMVVYLALKLVQGERLRWYAWAWLGGAAAAWAPALYFFVSGSSDWSTAPALSRHRNHHCMVMQFYDSHDLWHILSAMALYFSFNAMLTWDDGLSAVKKTDIPVF